MESYSLLILFGFCTGYGAFVRGKSHFCRGKTAVEIRLAATNKGITEFTALDLCVVQVWTFYKMAITNNPGDGQFDRATPPRTDVNTAAAAEATSPRARAELILEFFFTAISEERWQDAVEILKPNVALYEKSEGLGAIFTVAAFRDLREAYQHLGQTREAAEVTELLQTLTGPSGQCASLFDLVPNLKSAYRRFRTGDQKNALRELDAIRAELSKNSDTIMFAAILLENDSTMLSNSGDSLGATTMVRDWLRNIAPKIIVNQEAIEASAFGWLTLSKLELSRGHLKNAHEASIAALQLSDLTGGAGQITADLSRIQHVRVLCLNGLFSETEAHLRILFPAGLFDHQQRYAELGATAVALLGLSRYMAGSDREGVELVKRSFSLTDSCIAPVIGVATTPKELLEDQIVALTRAHRAPEAARVIELLAHASALK